MGASASTLSPETRQALATLPDSAQKELEAFAKSHGATIPRFPCEVKMQVMRWNSFESLGHIPRSDEAQQKGLLEDRLETVTCIFISHSWWERADAKNAASPDFTSGESAHLKYKVVCGGVRALIVREGLDASDVVLWCDYFSIDQLDEARKAQGVRSMAHYTTACDLMLIPVPTPHVVSDEYFTLAAASAADAATPNAEEEECMAFYPEEVADYGKRGWCRLEFFIFGLSFEMRHGPPDNANPLRLFAVGSAAELQQFKTVEFEGGERLDMPSQGAFSVETDRSAIRSLEEMVISAFGHAALARAANCCSQAEPLVDLGAKMLRDEHLPTLASLVRSGGGLRHATTLSFNACPSITHLPDLTGMESLRTLSCVRCHSLRSLPDLSGLPNLQHVKLEGCARLEALPKLRDGLEWDDEGQVPEHLRAAAGMS